MNPAKTPGKQRLRQTGKTHLIDTGNQQHGISTHMLAVNASSASNAQNDVLDRLLIRHSVYDAHGKIVATEIRPRMDAFSTSNDIMRLSDDTTLIAALFTLTENERQLLCPILVSIDIRSLANKTIDHLPAQYIIFSLRVGRPPDSKTLHQLKQRMQTGFRMLIEQRGETSLPAAIMRTVREACIDTRNLKSGQLIKLIDHLHNAGIRYIVASHIHCHEMLALCMQQKLNAFAGDFCDQMPPPGPHAIEINRLKILELIDRIIMRQGLADIAAHIKTDARLCYQMLGCLGHHHSTSPAINSIEQAVVVLGHDGLYQWLMLLLRTNATPSQHTHIALRRGLSRAHFMQEIAAVSLQSITQESAWMIGLLSVTDQLLHRTIAQCMARLNLSADIKLALIEGKGVGGLLLELALATEAGDRQAIETLCARCLVSPEVVNLAVVNALVLAEATPF